MAETDEDFLSEQEEGLLLTIARDTLESYVLHGKAPELDAFPLTDHLRDCHGAFVTLRNGDDLRGCIGYTSNHMPLAQAVQENAVNAASRDPRFRPVSARELPEITIEVSALTPGDSPDTPFKKVTDIGEIVIGRDGLYIERRGMRGGILLPQVAVEQGWTVSQFLTGVCRKAGYPDGAWNEPGTQLYRFSAQVFSETER
jgi:AmmeMemoRadiSam system protein A